MTCSGTNLPVHVFRTEHNVCRFPNETFHTFESLVRLWYPEAGCSNLNLCCAQPQPISPDDGAGCANGGLILVD
jgi:hypothetical protein